MPCYQVGTCSGCGPPCTTSDCSILVTGCTGAALPGATVDVTGPVSVSGTTDNAGTYRPPGLKPGSYAGTATYQGHSASFSFTIDADCTPVAVAVSISGTTEEARSFQVLAWGSCPLAGATVTITRASDGSTVGAWTTDASGDVTVILPEPGDYNYRVTHPDYLDKTNGIPLTSLACRNFAGGIIQVVHDNGIIGCGPAASMTTEAVPASLSVAIPDSGGLAPYWWAGGQTATVGYVSSGTPNSNGWDWSGTLTNGSGDTADVSVSIARTADCNDLCTGSVSISLPTFGTAGGGSVGPSGSTVNPVNFTFTDSGGRTGHVYE